MNKPLLVFLACKGVLIVVIGVFVIQALNKQVELTATLASRLAVSPGDVRRDLLSELVKVRAEIEASNARNSDARQQMLHELTRDRWTFTDQTQRAESVDERIKRLEEETKELKVSPNE